MRMSDWSSDVCSSDLLAHLIDIRAGHPESYRERKRRAEHDLGHAHTRFRRQSIRDRDTNAMLERLALFCVLRQDDDLGERGIRQFGRDIEHEARRALADIGGDNLRLGLLADPRSEEHTSELQSLMRISYAVFCLKKKKTAQYTH